MWCTMFFLKNESNIYEYMEIPINFEESLMITLININLKVNQSKVME